MRGRFAPIAARCCRPGSLRSLPYPVFQRALALPSPQFKCNRHACVAQFIRGGAIDHRSRYDHASHTQSGDGLGSRVARAAAVGQVALQNADHSFEYILKSARCLFCRCALRRSARRPWGRSFRHPRNAAVRDRRERPAGRHRRKPYLPRRLPSGSSISGQ